MVSLKRGCDRSLACYHPIDEFSGGDFFTFHLPLYLPGQQFYSDGQADQAADSSEINGILRDTEQADLIDN